MTQAPFLDYSYDVDTNTITDLQAQSVDKFFMKNVIHHCNIDNIITILDKYLKVSGQVEIIEPTVDSYESNRSLDIVWYRIIIPRYEVAIPPKRRVDYLQKLLATGKFKIITKQTNGVYDRTILKRRCL